MIVTPTYIGICGSDLQKIDAGADIASLGHEIVGVTTMDGEQVRVAVNPLISCDACTYCLSGRSMFCSSLRVIGRDQPGALSGELEAPKKNLIVLPDDLSSEVATLADPYAVVHHGMLMQPQILSSKRVLIIGDGVVASLNLFYLLLMGEEDARYTFLVKNEARAQAMSEWLREVFDDSALERVTITDHLNDEDVFEVAIEAVGRDQTETFTTAVRHLEPRGLLLSYGVYPPNTLQAVDLRTVMYKEIIVQGVNSYTHESLIAAVDDLTKYHSTIEKIIGEVFSFSNRDEAIAASRDKMKSVPKKIIIKMEQS